MEPQTPFNYDEILINLLLNSDRDLLEKLYKSFSVILESKYVLNKLSKKYYLPNLNTFSEFIIHYDRRNPEKRKLLCIDEDEQLLLAISDDDEKLVKELLTEHPEVLFDTFMLAGKMGNKKIIDMLISVESNMDNFNELLNGLAYASHNELFDYYSNLYKLMFKENPHKQAVIKYAAERDNFYVVKKLYDKKTRSNAIEGAAMKKDSKILEWLLDQEKIISQNDYKSILYGSLEGCNLDLAKHSYNLIHEKTLIYKNYLYESALKSNNIECMNWIEHIKGKYTIKDLIYIY